MRTSRPRERGSEPVPFEPLPPAMDGGDPMPVTQQQAQILAQLAVDSRPNGARRWDHAGVMAAIAKVRDRHLADVALAVIRAADDRNAETPGVINAPGSLHWRERGDRPAPTERHDPAHLCGTCSLAQAECEKRWADDHEFQPSHQLKAVAVPAREKSLIERLAELPPIPNGTVIPFASTQETE